MTFFYVLPYYIISQSSHGEWNKREACSNAYNEFNRCTEHIHTIWHELLLWYLTTNMQLVKSRQLSIEYILHHQFKIQIFTTPILNMTKFRPSDPFCSEGSISFVILWKCFWSNIERSIQTLGYSGELETPESCFSCRAHTTSQLPLSVWSCFLSSSSAPSGIILLLHDIQNVTGSTKPHSCCHQDLVVTAVLEPCLSAWSTNKPRRHVW